MVNEFDIKAFKDMDIDVTDLKNEIDKDILKTVKELADVQPISGDILDYWFKPKRINEKDLPRCKDCGDKVCVCGEDETGWWAHCMTCDNHIYQNLDPVANKQYTQYGAAMLWKEINKPK